MRKIIGNFGHVVGSLRGNGVVKEESTINRSLRNFSSLKPSQLGGRVPRSENKCVSCLIEYADSRITAAVMLPSTPWKMYEKEDSMWGH